MRTIIKRMNAGLMLAFVVLLLSGLLIMVIGNDHLSTELFFIASIVIPLLVAGKGIEFMIKNQIRKAFLSIVLLSLVCMLSIIFVFV